MIGSFFKKKLESKMAVSSESKNEWLKGKLFMEIAGKNLPFSSGTSCKTVTVFNEKAEIANTLLQSIIHTIVIINVK
jgi:hypothetical protein